MPVHSDVKELCYSRVIEVSGIYPLSRCILKDVQVAYLLTLFFL